MRRSPSRALPLAVAVVVGLATLTGCGGGGSGATAFRRQGVDDGPAHPYVRGVARTGAAVTPPTGVQARAYSARTPGLYAAPTAASDTSALATALRADPAQARAWARAAGIDPGDVARYLASLTPVVLRTDTAVTEHGWSGSGATREPTVLEAGTEVLVDDHGTPVATVDGGNPLTDPPSTDDATYHGPSWHGFAPDSVITVLPSSARLARIVLADPSGAGVVRPIGSTGATDTPFDPNVPIARTIDAVADASGSTGATASIDPSVATVPTTPTTTADRTADAVSLTGTATPGDGCFGQPPASTTVTIGGTEHARTVSLPSAAIEGAPALEFPVAADGSVAGDVTGSPAGAPGLEVTYHFEGQLQRNDPPTPWTVHGTLTTTGAGVTCVVTYDASGQSAPTPTPSSTVPAGPSVTTYVARYAGPIDGPDGAVSNDCARSRFLDQPFTVTVRVREGVDGGEVRVLGGGGEAGVDVSLGYGVPTRDLRGGITDGNFRVGGTTTYDDVYEGTFRASWSGGVGARRTRPAEFPLTVAEHWERHRGFIGWLNGSGGPEDFDCSVVLRAVRQA